MDEFQRAISHSKTSVIDYTTFYSVTQQWRVDDETKKSIVQIRRATPVLSMRLGIKTKGIDTQDIHGRHAVRLCCAMFQTNGTMYISSFCSPLTSVTKSCSFFPVCHCSKASRSAAEPADCNSETAPTTILQTPAARSHWSLLIYCRRCCPLVTAGRLTELHPFWHNTIYT